MAELDPPSVPNLRPGLLARIAREVFGEATHPLVSVSAVCLRSGRRHILDGGAFPLADLVAASSAVPGMLAPHRVGGDLYVDGGMWSTTSVDAAAHAESVIVIAPLAGPNVGMIGRGAGLLLERELRRWRRRHPDRRITMIRPDRAMAQLRGPHPAQPVRRGPGQGVYPLAYEQGLRWAERLQVSDAAWWRADRAMPHSSIARFAVGRLAMAPRDRAQSREQVRADVLDRPPISMSRTRTAS